MATQLLRWITLLQGLRDRRSSGEADSTGGVVAGQCDFAGETALPLLRSGVTLGEAHTTPAPSLLARAKPRPPWQAPTSPYTLV